MDTVTVKIPEDWLEGVSLDADGLRRVVMLGLRQLRQQQGAESLDAEIARTLMNTGRVSHLSVAFREGGAPAGERQPSPTLPGPSLSDTIIAQRRGEL